LDYKNSEVSTTAFHNHHDILIKRPGKPDVKVPILRADEFYIREEDGNPMVFARYQDKGDYRDIRLGTISKEDLNQAYRWVIIANSRLPKFEG